jgi:hypothetical protein
MRKPFQPGQQVEIELLCPVRGVNIGWLCGELVSFNHTHAYVRPNDEEGVIPPVLVEIGLLRHAQREELPA